MRKCGKTRNQEHAWRSRSGCGERASRRDRELSAPLEDGKSPKEITTGKRNHQLAESINRRIVRDQLAVFNGVVVGDAMDLVDYTPDNGLTLGDFVVPVPITFNPSATVSVAKEKPSPAWFLERCKVREDSLYQRAVGCGAVHVTARTVIFD